MESEQFNKIVIFWGDQKAAVEDEQISRLWDLFTIAFLLSDDLLEMITGEELENHAEEHLSVELYANPRRISLHYNDIKLVEFFLDDNSYTQYFGEHKAKFDITRYFGNIHRGYEAFSRGLKHGS